jgi:hypothetical protein
MIMYIIVFNKTTKKEFVMNTTVNFIANTTAAAFALANTTLSVDGGSNDDQNAGNETLKTMGIIGLVAIATTGLLLLRCYCADRAEAADEASYLARMTRNANATANTAALTQTLLNGATNVDSEV